MSPRKNPHAVALGKRGGQVRSDAKTAAARRNGKKGGRKALDKPNRLGKNLRRGAGVQQLQTDGADSHTG